MTNKTRQCQGPCKRTLPESEFPWDGRKFRAFCRPCHNTRRRKNEPQIPTRSSPVVDPDIVRLVKAAKKPVKFSDLCNTLDMSPAKLSALIKRAVERNAPLHVEHDLVTVAPSPALESVQDVPITSVVGEPTRIGAISDTHLGSKYCLRGAIREIVKWMYEQGIRDILHAGDVLEGCYNHARYELSHVGFDAQMDDAAKCFPQLPGLRYHFISGNHDFTFEEQIGMRAGVAIQEAMRARGRRDWFCYGDRDAYLTIGGAVVNLWHPRGGPAYARSYNTQKRIEGYTAIKPQILLMGHYHQYCYVYERGIHGVMMPCFQGSGSNFAKSLRGAPAIGGLILEWEMSDTNRIHNLKLNPRFFYEREDIYAARNDIDAIELPAVGRDRRYRQEGQRD